MDHSAVIRKPLHFFLLISLFFILLSLGTLFGEKRGVHEILFNQGQNFFADTFNIYNYLVSENIYAGDGPATPGYYGDSLPRFYRNQPPMTYLCFELQRRLIQRQHVHFLMAVYVSLLCCLPLFYLLCRKLRAGEAERVLFGACILFSGLFIHSLERGNIILLSVLCVTFFFFFQRSGNRWLRELSLLALAMAAALKVYPALLGMILLVQQEGRRALRLLLYGILLAFLPFLCFPGGFSLIPDMCVNVFSPLSIEQPAAILFASWIPLLRAVTGKDFFLICHSLYLLGLFLSVLSLLLVPFQKPYWRRTLLLLFPLVLAPKIGGAYNILYLLPGMVLFFNEAETGAAANLTASLFAGLIVPVIVPQAMPFPGLKMINSLSLDILFLLLLGCSLKSFCGFLAGKGKKTGETPPESR